MTDLIAQVGELSTEARAELIQRSIEQLTVREVLDLVKRLEEKWDVSATPSFGGAVPPPQEPEEEAVQTEFTVGIKEYGQKKIAVVKAVRALTGLSLKDSKAVVDKAPVMVQDKLSREDAEKAKSALEEAGATAEIK